MKNIHKIEYKNKMREFSNIANNSLDFLEPIKEGKTLLNNSLFDKYIYYAVKNFSKNYLDFFLQDSNKKTDLISLKNSIRHIKIKNLYTASKYIKENIDKFYTITFTDLSFVQFEKEVFQSLVYRMIELKNCISIIKLYDLFNFEFSLESFNDKYGNGLDKNEHRNIKIEFLKREFDKAGI